NYAVNVRAPSTPLMDRQPGKSAGQWDTYKALYGAPRMNPFSVPRARKPCNDSFFVVRYLFLRYLTSEFRMNGSIQRSFLMFWLCSAAVVTGARLFNPIPMSLDLAFQIQAAQNLLAGHGLSVFSRYAPDVAAPSGLVLLTVFPSG